jgi:hypothetical protein
LNGRRDGYRCHRTSPEVSQTSRLIGRLIYLFVDRIDRHELKDNRIANFTGTIGMAFDLVACADHLIHKPQSTGHRLKKQHCFAIDRVICEGTICARQLHCSALAVSEVIELAVFPPIIVTVLLTFGTCHYDDQRKPGRCNHASLLLAAKSLMNVGTSIVHAPSFEAPAHWPLPSHAEGQLIQ